MDVTPTATANDEAILVLCNVRFTYRGVEQRTVGKPGAETPVSIGGTTQTKDSRHVDILALDNVNLSIRSGDRVGIVGHNGAGKSTLLRVMAGIYPPDSGTITTNGSVSAIFGQMHGMDPELTGYENIRIRGLFLNLTDQQIRDSVDEIADFSGLGPYLSMPIRNYSVGMRMRLGFAVSTCFEPDCLLLDEWLNVGDAEFHQKAQERSKEFFERARAIVVVSHSRSMIERMCDRVLTLDHGKLVDERPVEHEPENKATEPQKTTPER